jgi:3-mercaptopyruvate sulfurtransferase SseA
MSGELTSNGYPHDVAWMGCRNVHSLIGGYKGLVAAGWPMKRGE